MKGQAWIWLLVIVGLLVMTGIITVPPITVPPIFKGVQPSLPPAPPKAEIPIGCPDDLSTTVKARAKNPLNASLHYVPAPIEYVDLDRNTRVGGETLTESTTGTYSTGVSLTCGKEYKVMVVNDASYVAVSKSTGVLSGDTVYVDLDVPQSSEVEFAVYDSGWDNITTPWVQDTTTSAQTFGSGTVNSYYLKVRAKSSSAQFGSDELAVWICADFNTAKFSKSNGVTISGLIASPTLPDYCSANGYDKAWKISAIKSAEGERVYTVTLRADLGDPSSSDDVKFLFVDEHYYTKLDGTKTFGTADDSLADVGETNRYVTFDIA